MMCKSLPLSLFSRLFLLVLLAFGAFVPQVLAQSSNESVDSNQTLIAQTETPLDQVRNGVEAVGGDPSQAEETVNSTLRKVINILSWVIGIIAVIVIIVQGLRLILSGGNSQTVAAARTGIIYAFVGLAVVVISQSLVFFFLDKF